MTRTTFARTMTTSEPHAIEKAAELANANGSPVGVWQRDLWFTCCDIAPDLIEPDPEPLGWQLVAVVDPDEVTA